MEEKDIERINELARKKKSTGLTLAEEAEQQRLRRQYLDEWKASLQAQLDNTYIIGPDGEKRKLQKKVKN